MSARLAGFAAVLVTLAAAPAAQAAATTYTVTTTADAQVANGCVDPNVACSLRDAVAAANVAANAGSTIVLPAGTYPIAAGEMLLEQPMTITGAGARNTVLDGSGHSDRIFELEQGFNPVVTMNDLTLTGGTAPTGITVNTPFDAGAILVGGHLTLQRVAVRGNTAQQAGGAIATPGIESGATWSVVLKDSTVSANRVTGSGGNGQGGGLAVTGDLTIINSTVSGNTVDNAGTLQGAGVFVTDGTNGPTVGTSAVVLTNSVIAGNTMTTGVGSGLFALSVTSETIRNSVIAGNTATGGMEADCAPGGTITTANDISGDSSCMFSDAGSKQGTDPQLGALADNGGPVDTRLPAPGGPAFDTGGATSCPAADARGIVRPQAAACDIGAVELFPPTATTLAATEIGVTTATLAGTATTSPLSASTATFEYGTTTAYGQSTAAQAVPAGSSGLALSAALSGLSPSSTYHARLVVQGREGTARGADITFTTAAPPAPPPPPALPELVISHLRVKHRCVRAATVSSPKPGGSGLSFSYRLSEPATVTFAILRRVHSPRWLVCPRRGGTFPVTFAPLTSHTGSGSGGAQSTTLATGKTVGRTAAMAAASRLRLPAGTYLLRLTARTADGRTSRPAEVNFWVVTARRRAAHHHSAGSAAAPSRR